MGELGDVDVLIFDGNMMIIDLLPILGYSIVFRYVFIYVHVKVFLND